MYENLPISMYKLGLIFEHQVLDSMIGIFPSDSPFSPVFLLRIKQAKPPSKLFD